MFRKFITLASAVLAVFLFGALFGSSAAGAQTDQAPTVTASVIGIEQGTDLICTPGGQGVSIGFTASDDQGLIFLSLVGTAEGGTTANFRTVANPDPSLDFLNISFFNGDEAGLWTFELTVVDTAGQTASATVDYLVEPYTCSVTPPTVSNLAVSATGDICEGGLEVTITFDAADDVGLASYRVRDLLSLLVAEGVLSGTNATVAEAIVFGPESQPGDYPFTVFVTNTAGFTNPLSPRAVYVLEPFDCTTPVAVVSPGPTAPTPAPANPQPVTTQVTGPPAPAPVASGADFIDLTGSRYVSDAGAAGFGGAAVASAPVTAPFGGEAIVSAPEGLTLAATGPTTTGLPTVGIALLVVGLMTVGIPPALRFSHARSRQQSAR